MVGWNIARHSIGFRLSHHFESAVVLVADKTSRNDAIWTDQRQDPSASPCRRWRFIPHRLQSLCARFSQGPPSTSHTPHAFRHRQCCRQPVRRRGRDRYGTARHSSYAGRPYASSQRGNMKWRRELTCDVAVECGTGVGMKCAEHASEVE